jgi:hypothetical protein
MLKCFIKAAAGILARRVMIKSIFSIILVIMFYAGSEIYAADSKIIAAPNPWVPNGGKASSGGGTTPSGGITFINLPNSGELSIFTISGNLVSKQQFASGGGGASNWQWTQTTSSGLGFKWNGKNDDNVDVASGVYLWVVSSPEATKNGKLIIVR